MHRITKYQLGQRDHGSDTRVMICELRQSRGVPSSGLAQFSDAGLHIKYLCEMVEMKYFCPWQLILLLLDYEG